MNNKKRKTFCLIKKKENISEDKTISKWTSNNFSYIKLWKSGQDPLAISENAGNVYWQNITGPDYP